MAIHSNILAWKIPWTEEPGGLQSMGSQESNMTYWLNHHHHNDLFSSLKILALGIHGSNAAEEPDFNFRIWGRRLASLSSFRSLCLEFFLVLFLVSKEPQLYFCLLKIPCSLKSSWVLRCVFSSGTHQSFFSHNFSFVDTPSYVLHIFHLYVFPTYVLPDVWVEELSQESFSSLICDLI